jgi:sialidase-1
MKKTGPVLIVLMICIGIMISSCRQQVEETAVKSYIAVATAENIRNDEGDVIVCPGYYLAAYTKFKNSPTDIGSATIVGKLSSDTTGKIWGNEFVISPNIGKINVMSVSLYRVDSNTIDCYFIVKNSTADTRLYLAASPDNGKTWSAAEQVIYENAYDIFVNASVHSVNRGRIVAPVASVPYFSKGYTFSNYACYSDDGGTTWTKSSVITPPVSGGGLEPKIVQLMGDTCLMNIRTSAGFQYFSISTDNCKTWGKPYISTLKSPSSPAEIVSFSGELIAVYNYSTSARNPFSISVSSDKGATWKHVSDIETGDLSVYGWSYPSVTISNGYLLISYYETVNKSNGVQYYNQKFTKIKISTLI